MALPKKPQLPFLSHPPAQYEYSPILLCLSCTNQFYQANPDFITPANSTWTTLSSIFSKLILMFGTMYPC